MVTTSPNPPGALRGYRRDGRTRPAADLGSQLVRAPPQSQGCRPHVRATHDGSLVPAALSEDRPGERLGGDVPSRNPLETEKSRQRGGHSSHKGGYRTDGEATCPQHIALSLPSVRGLGGRGGDSQNASRHPGQLRGRQPSVAAKPVWRPYCCKPQPEILSRHDSSPNSSSKSSTTTSTTAPAGYQVYMKKKEGPIRTCWRRRVRMENKQAENLEKEVAENQPALDQGIDGNGEPSPAHQLVGS